MMTRQATSHTRRHVLGRGALAALAPVALAAFGACGAPAGRPAQPARALSGTVQIWANRAFPFHEDVGGEIAASFMAKAPAVTIRSEPLAGNGVEKLTAAVAAGDPPELVSIGAHEVQTLAASGAVTALEDYLQRSGVLR
jgi:ABC-type glycerol-3-phosphate transport system substrate-binding protein